MSRGKSSFGRADQLGAEIISSLRGRKLFIPVGAMNGCTANEVSHVA